MSGPPPSRYRIEERGRRLVVIDTRTGETKGAAPPPGEATPPPAARPGEPLAGREPPVIRTRRWFDRKAPRTIVLTQQRVQRLYLIVGTLFAVIAVLFFFFPGAQFLFLLFIAALALGRKGIAGIATPWLDLAEADSRR